MRKKHRVVLVLSATIAASIMSFASADAQEAQDRVEQEPSATEEFVLFTEYRDHSIGLDSGLRSRSRGQTTLGERIIHRSDKGTEIEYFIPGRQPPPIDRWKFPARVLVAPDGTKTLLNGDEAQERLSAYISEKEITREACGQWIIFHIAAQFQCENQAVIDSIDGFGMRPALMEEGAKIELPGALSYAELRQVGIRNGRDLLRAEIGLDPEYRRQKQAETDVILAPYRGEEISLEDALAALTDFSASGALIVEFEVDQDGLVWRREDTLVVTVSGESSDNETRVSRTITRRFAKKEWAAWQASDADDRDWAFPR